VSDWKQTVTLVDLADVEPAFLDAHGLVRPAERLRPRSRLLAEVAATTRFARVDRALAKLLHQAGVATYDVGYHRGSDGLLFADENRHGRHSRNVDIAGLLSRLLADGGDDDAYDGLRSDAVDAVLRVLSEGLLTERAVIVAASVPPLSARDESDKIEDTSGDYEGLQAGPLPDVAPEIVERVASALSEVAASPPPGPHLPAEARRAVQRKAGAVGLVGLAAAMLGLAYAHIIAVIAVPVVVFCTVIVVVHGVALRDQAHR